MRTLLLTLMAVAFWSTPYTIVVAALLLLLSTPFVLSRTPTDIFPDIRIPVIAVVWTYRGLPPRAAPVRNLIGANMSLRRDVFVWCPPRHRLMARISSI